MRMDVDRHQLVELHAVSTLGEPAYSSSTSAARRESTARWLIEPLSVISPVSSDGGSSSTMARAMRLELPVLLAANERSRSSKSLMDALPAGKISAAGSARRAPTSTPTRPPGAKGPLEGGGRAPPRPPRPGAALK